MTLIEKQFKRHDLMPAVEAARLFNITNDYVSLLCRQGKVEGILLGKRLWYVNRKKLQAYLKFTAQQKEARQRELSQQILRTLRARNISRV